MLCSAMHCQLVRKRQNCSFPWDFVTLPKEDRATAIGNLHTKLGKDRACGSGDMLADRQTDRHTHTDVLMAILCHHSRGRSNKFTYVRTDGSLSDGFLAEPAIVRT